VAKTISSELRLLDSLGDNLGKSLKKSSRGYFIANNLFENISQKTQDIVVNWSAYQISIGEISSIDLVFESIPFKFLL
jgi:hypothetical protein